MTIRELLKQISSVPEDAEIILVVDEEGLKEGTYNVFVTAIERAEPKAVFLEATMK